MQTAKNNLMKSWINILVLLSISTLLLSKKTNATSLILLTSTALLFCLYRLYEYLKYEKILFINNDHKKITYAFLIFLGASFFFYLYHSEEINFLDKPAKLIGFILVSFLLIKFPQKLNVSLISICTASVIAGCVAIYQIYYLSFPRAFDNINAIQGGDIAMSLGIFCIIICIYAAESQKRIMLFLGASGAALGLIASFLSASRGAWICLPLLAILILYRNRKHISFKKVLIGLLVLGFIAGVFIVKPNLSERIHSAYNEAEMYYNGGDKKTSTGYRFELWKSAFYAWKSKPILGWGRESIKEVQKIQGKNSIIITDLYKNNFHAHNQFLEELSTRGLVGFLAFLSLLIIPLHVFSSYRNYQNPNVRLFSDLGMVHVFLIATYCLTQSFFAHNSGMIFYALMVVIFYAALLKETVGKCDMEEKSVQNP
ncbi:MAG: hypothetical protein CSA61_01575 [Neptuniibacter caesariensis]|uniref:O-antigen ligase-related domain-containing protein n=1 Tax=Neptuniibacter caesariensis TaxID=207954 RepID=A0A2G6JDM6_NEPCE|nr:MAG: hypothetical protein CSA61_01575 [Neptuniibacter caesariensis]